MRLSLIPARIRIYSALLIILALLIPPLSRSSLVRAAATVRVNFQNEAATTPTGYIRDYGLGFGPRSKGEAQLAGTATDSSGLSYGWVVPGTTNPRNLVGNGRDRNLVLDQRLDTVFHMQANVLNPFTGVPEEGAWEIELAQGTYDVTVAVGDPQASTTPERHTIRLEGETVISNFEPSGAAGTATRTSVATMRVQVADGRLTVDAQGGFNTKIAYIDIVSTQDTTQPYVTSVTPANNTSGVLRNTSITVNVAVPNGGIRADSINDSTVMLLRASDLTPIAATMNTTGGGDAISLQPTDYLDPNTRYIFRVTDGVLDATGRNFVPFNSSFTTGTGGGPGSGSGTSIAFELKRSVAQGFQFSSLAIGPDNRLYASSLTGDIYRYAIGPTGLLTNMLKISTIPSIEGGPRAIIGLAFDPDSTATNLVLWVSYNGPYVDEGAEDWTGRIARLSGADLGELQNYVINLPHSYKDHMANSLAFGPDKALYISIGSNSAMGAPDGAWGSRPEHLLSASILRVNTRAITNPPLNVKTEEDGNYNPYAANAPVTLYATGIRNAYDLVWHSNGKLYSATNGSAAGGNSPGTPKNVAALPACKSRIDDATRGDYVSPAVPARYGISDRNDFLFRVDAGGYYGHPNPMRCEWVLNGGNTTGDIDAGEVTEYPVGVRPDRNYRGFAYDFGVHKSPNGSIEYTSNAFGGELKGWLIVTRYSENNDLVALKPGGSLLNIVEARERVQGTDITLSNPLDLIEDRRNGNLYVIEFNTTTTSRITLLRPKNDTSPRISINPSERVFTDIASDNIASAAQNIVIENSGKSSMTVSSITLTGSDATQFKIVGPVPTSINGGETATIQLAFNATSRGPKSAILSIATNAANGALTEAVVRGLGTEGQGGSKEPSLQWVLDTYEINLNVGDDNSATNVIHSNASKQRAPLLGSEINAQRFVRADSANPVIIEPLAVFGPTTNSPVVSFGWYPAGNIGTKSMIFEVGNSPSSNGQQLAPALLPGAKLTFDPGTRNFGFYSTWPFFGNRVLASEDALNTFPGAIPHHVRVYPLRNSTGSVVKDAYIIATEENTSGFDYQDVVVIARNLKPAGNLPPPVNNPPVVQAGSDLTVNVGSIVTLQGTVSDLDNDLLSYEWVQTGGPTVQLEGNTTLAPSFTAPSAPSSLTFKLTASDGMAQASESMTIRVVNSPIVGLAATNNGPTVLGQPTTFNATISNGNNVSFSWDFGDSQRANGASVAHTYQQEGIYTAIVTATNGRNIVNATVRVDVTNDAPNVEAGSNQRVRVGDGVVLDASTSRDPDNHNPISFEWTQLGGTRVDLSNATTARATFNAPTAADTLLFLITVTDAMGKSATDQITVVVEPPSRPNNAPVARAGDDRRVRVNGFVSLDGSASFDPDGDVLTYAWSQIGGPAVQLSSANTAELSFLATPTPAELLFELTTTDGFGKSASDKVTIAVEAADRPNVAPIASAGIDQRVSVRAGATLDARASSDPDRDALTYSWRQTAGPAVTLVGTGATASFFAPNTSVTLKFEVTVTDSFEAKATDEVEVVVEAANRPNTKPVPLAGPDQRVPVGKVVTLNAGGSTDPDKDALSFTWRQMSGTAVTLVNAENVKANFVAPNEPATLVFEVTATDSFGANDVSRMVVTVEPTNRPNAAPVIRVSVSSLAAIQVSTSAPTQAGTTIILNASGSSDPDGDALSFSWRQVSSSAVTLIGADSAVAVFGTPRTPTTLVFEVVVTDSFGATSSTQLRASPDRSTVVYFPFVAR